MKFLVDANVLSEPTKRAPHRTVLRWLAAHEQDLAIDPIILGEIEYGILLLPDGERRRRLESWFEEGIVRIQCLPWTAPSGRRWAELIADLRSRGQAMPIKDSLIAATALHHGLTVVTRNTKDFEKAGVAVLDPFGPAIGQA